MVSSRRLAREWALKILYQVDVGKHTPQEALDAALETLRREFVQRGSRTASGSRVEEMWLEYVTNALRDTIPTLRLPFERALSSAAGRLCGEVPYWLEVRLEKSFRHQAPGVPLDPPRLLTPLADSALTPSEVATATPEERARYWRFVRQARETLPLLLDKEIKRTALATAKSLAAGRSQGMAGGEMQRWLREQREGVNREAQERWQKVGTIVQKQTGDWLRTAAFAEKLVYGALEKRGEIDAAVAALASGWRLERQVVVDRNILRLAGYEMLFLPGIPTAASINEAVELAKKYSTAESGRFVNGVLGALAGQVGEKLSPSQEAKDAIESDEKDEAVDLPDVEDMEDAE